jgi:UDP-N-acetylmuramoylalanine--D-glutamate ligase
MRVRHADVEFRVGVSEIPVEGLDRLIVSPGIALDHPVLAAVIAAGVPLLSDIDLFLEATARDRPIYAITGTNGKSTVTALVGHVLGLTGRNPGVGGNLGDAALDLLSPAHDCYVLELSSFQLERMATYPMRAATVLNLTDDHLDRHSTMERYGVAKRRIYRGVRRAVANRDDVSTFPATPVDELVTFGAGQPTGGHWGIALRGGERMLCRGARPVLASADLPIRGQHNELNTQAALALVDGDVDLEAAAAAVPSFRGLPHRCQPVGCVDGVRYIDDSKATTVGAAIAALDGIGGPIVLIAGGDGKGADFAPLRAVIARHVRHLVLLGRDAPAIEHAVAGAVSNERVADLRSAVRRAAAAARPGDTVLLSPACASLDMFRDYRERGDLFAAYVAELVGERR